MVLSEFFNNDSIKSLLYVDKDWLSFGLDELASNTLHFIVTIPYYISKFLALIIDTAIDKLYSLNLLNDAIGNVFSVGTTLWNEFFSLFGVLFFGVTLFWVIKDFYMGSIQKSVIRLLTFFILLAVGNGFFTNGSQWVKEFNNFSGEAQVALTSSVSSNISNLDNELITELGGSNNISSTDAIRNSFYTMSVLKPFALINFGKSDIKASTYKKYLVTQGEDVKKKNEKIEKNVKKQVTDSKNQYMSTSTFFEKFFIGLTSLLNTVVLGGIVLIISFLNPLLQLLVLLLILIMPILMIVSLLPNMGRLSYNGGLLMGKAIAAKMILGVAFGMMFTLFDVIDSFFTGSSINYYMLGFILKAAFLFIGWKKRNELTKLFNGQPTSLTDFSPHNEVTGLASSVVGSAKIAEKSERFKNSLQEGREWTGPAEFNEHASDIILSSNENKEPGNVTEATTFSEIKRRTEDNSEERLKETTQTVHDDSDNSERKIDGGVHKEDTTATVPISDTSIKQGSIEDSMEETQKLDTPIASTTSDREGNPNYSVDQFVSYSEEISKDTQSRSNKELEEPAVPLDNQDSVTDSDSNRYDEVLSSSVESLESQPNLETIDKSELDEKIVTDLYSTEKMENVISSSNEESSLIGSDSREHEINLDDNKELAVPIELNDLNNQNQESNDFKEEQVFQAGQMGHTLENNHPVENAPIELENEISQSDEVTENEIVKDIEHPIEVRDYLGTVGDSEGVEGINPLNKPREEQIKSIVKLEKGDTRKIDRKESLSEVSIPIKDVSLDD